MVQGLLGEGDDNDQLTGYYGDLASTLQGWCRLVVFSKLMKAVIIS